jgi:hypothetical protein
MQKIIHCRLPTWRPIKAVKKSAVPNSNNFPHVTLRGRTSSAGRYTRGSDLHSLDNTMAATKQMHLNTNHYNCIAKNQIHRCFSTDLHQLNSTKQSIGEKHYIYLHIVLTFSNGR